MTELYDRLQRYSVSDYYGLSTSGEFVEVLNFRHFARYMSFVPTGKQGRKKQIMDGIEVSVVLHVV